MKTEILNINKTINNELAKHWEKQGELKKAICEAIHDMLTEMGGEIEVDFDNDDCPPVVVYDGGNHPEYASTICSIVQSVKAIESNGYKRFEVNLEEEPEVGDDRFEFGDIVQIFDFVEARYKNFSEQK